jgi:hypothetical protein
MCAAVLVPPEKTKKNSAPRCSARKIPPSGKRTAFKPFMKLFEIMLVKLKVFFLTNASRERYKFYFTKLISLALVSKLILKKYLVKKFVF